MNLIEVSELAIIKRCELCLKYSNCILYDEVCQNLEFLKNFLDIAQSNQVAQYCKGYKIERSERSFNPTPGNKLFREWFL